MAEIISSDSVKTGGKHVVEKMTADLPGGAELDLSQASATEYDSNEGYVPEGTPIYKEGSAYRPLLSGDVGTALTEDKCVGVLFQDVHKDKPYASIVLRGVVNEDKLPFAINANIKAALKDITFVSYP